MTNELKHYAVTLKSVPGYMAQYGPGDVEVWACDEDHAKEKAFRKLQLTAFPDRVPSCWLVLGVRLVAASSTEG